MLEDWLLNLPLVWLALVIFGGSYLLAQQEIVKSLETALESHRQAIVISHSRVSSLKWAGLLLQALCTLIAIGLVHNASPRLCGVALGLFATGIAVSVLLIAAYSRPFTGDISVDPGLLKEVQATLGDK
ncbi:MAG: bestrophin-like domain [Methyloceanibacter sp.]